MSNTLNIKQNINQLVIEKCLQIFQSAIKLLLYCVAEQLIGCKF